MNALQLTLAVKAEARRLGFDFCRVADIGSAPHADFFDAWLDAGRAGETAYLARNREKRRWPALLGVDTADPADAPPGESVPFQSMIVLAVNHFQLALTPDLRDDPSRGLIASYAWGDDYHDIIRPQLHVLDAFIRNETGRQRLGKCLVDTGPVLERDWAMATGIGFTGKNCCTIHPHAGSWLLLATICVPEGLVADPSLHAEESSTSPPATPAAVLAGLPPNRQHGVWRGFAATDAQTDQVVGTCGGCTRCLDDCPTDAFVGPYHLDPQRCISYWTIESRQPIPRALRPAFGNRIFGCDVCQTVCPWNRRLAVRPPSMDGLRVQADRIAPPLLEGFAAETPYWLDQTAFSERFRRSPIKRAKRTGMLRNVCVALGNWADTRAVPALARALNDEALLVRGHAAWALGEVARRGQVAEAARLLRQRLAVEGVTWVRQEIALALT